MRVKKVFFVSLLLAAAGCGVLFTWLHRTPHHDRRVLLWLSRVRLNGESAALQSLRTNAPVAVPELRFALRPENDHSRRMRAAWTLGELGQAASNSVPDLVGLVQDKDYAVRMYAIESLGKLGASRRDILPKTESALLRQVTNADPYLCCYAARSVLRIERSLKEAGVYGPTRELGYTRTFLHATAPGVRLWGVKRVDQLEINDPQVLQEARTLLNDTNGWVRAETATFLKGGHVMNFKFISNQ